MPAYFIADITIKEPEKYKEYLAGFMEIFERHGGVLKAVSSAPVEAVEGDWSPSGIVLMEFPTLSDAKAWKDDPDYIALAQIRHASADTKMILVEGL